MQMEVTEKEVRGIYSQRYFNSLGKRKYLPLALLIVGAAVGFMVCAVMAQVNAWLGIAVLAILLSPSVYMSQKVSRASGKYARDQIWEHHPEEILEHKPN